MADENPVPFLTPLYAMCAQHREMYMSWQAAGFTEVQAFELLKAMIAGYASGAGAVQNGPSSS